MSVYAYMYVWENSRQKSTALLLLLALADYAHQDTGECFPGISSLARKLRTTERNVQLLLRRLEKTGEIVIIPNDGKATGTGNTNRYILKGYVEWYQAVKKISPLDDEAVKLPVSRGEISCIQGVKKLSPKPLVNPSKNRSTHTTGKKDDPEREKAKILIQAWADTCGMFGTFDNRARIAQAKKMLAWDEPPTVEEVKQVVVERLKIPRKGQYEFAYIAEDILERRQFAAMEAAKRQAEEEKRRQLADKTELHSALMLGGGAVA